MTYELFYVIFIKEKKNIINLFNFIVYSQNLNFKYFLFLIKYLNYLIIKIHYFLNNLKIKLIDF